MTNKRVMVLHSIQLLSLDEFEKVIVAVVSRGYSRDVVETSLLQLVKEGVELSDKEKAVESVINVIHQNQESYSQSEDDQKNKGYPNSEELHKQEIKDKLFKVVAIPSVVDVLNGFRKWFSVVPSSDVAFVHSYNL